MGEARVGRVDETAEWPASRPAGKLKHAPPKASSVQAGRPVLRYVCLDFRQIRRGGRERVEHFRRDAMRTAALAQTEAVHDAPGVIGIVAHAKLSEDGIGEARRGPAVGHKAGCARSRLIDFGHGFELIGGEAAGTARRAALAERFDAFPAQRVVPSGRRSAANPEFAGNLGLREPRLQVLCG